MADLVGLGLQLVELAPQLAGYACLHWGHSSLVLCHGSPPQRLCVGIVLERMETCQGREGGGGEEGGGGGEEGRGKRKRRGREEGGEGRGEGKGEEGRGKRKRRGRREEKGEEGGGG